MKITKREKALDGGTDHRKDGTKTIGKRTIREEHGREINIEEKRRRHEHDSYSTEFDDAEHFEKKDAMNGNSRGGKRRGAVRSRESNHGKRSEYDRRDDVKVSRKAVSKRHEMDTPRRYVNRDDSPRARKGRDVENYFNERHNRFAHYEEERGYYRNGLNGGGRYEESRRSPYVEDLAERNKRTVFIGNIPLLVKSTSHLLDILGVDESIVEEARIRPPKFFRYEPESARPDKKNSQKAYITLKQEKDVKPLLEKDGLTYAGHVFKIDMVIHSKHYDREKTVLVKSLSFKVTEGQLFDMFSCFGRVKGYRLIRDRRTNKSLGYGFIYFEDKESVDKAIRAMNGKRIQNRHLIVTAMEHDNDSGHRHPPAYWNHPNGERRFYEYRVRKDISKMDNSYRRK